jgi:hypothetical protein
MSAAVTNPGCERTAENLTQSLSLVNRTLRIFYRFLKKFAEVNATRNGSQHGNRIDVDCQLDAVGGRMEGRYGLRQSL